MLCVVCLQRRVGSGASLNRVGKKLRTSWQETDIDRAIAEAEGTEEAQRLKEIWKVCVRVYGLYIVCVCLYMVCVYVSVCTSCVGILCNQVVALCNTYLYDILYCRCLHT